MKLIVELIEFALNRGWLTDEEKLYLETEGYYAFDWSDQARRHDPLEIDEEEILGARSHSSNHRGGKGQSRPAKPKLTVEELNQRVQEEWKKLAEQFPRYQALWDSWKTGRLAQVFADGFTLNDVYVLLSMELCDFHDFSGPAPDAFRQLLRQVGASTGKYSWGIKCPEMAAMVEFLPFRQQLFDDVKTLYETDRKRFASLSSQNGKLDFPNWEKAVQTDTTSMKVWTILKIDFEPVEQDKIPDILTWKTALAFAMQLDCDFVTELLSELEKWDRDSSTVITANKLKYVILKSVTIPDGTREIGWFAFGYCDSLTSVVIPKGVTAIGEKAFRECRSLTSVVIPKGVKAIGRCAFDDCSSLTSVVIPGSIRVLGSQFSHLEALKFVTISEGLREIGNSAFSGCSSLISVVIPESVMVIDFGAFRDCNSLTSVVIPQSVSRIGSHAFSNCSSLTSMVIPENVCSIGSGMFSGCSSLTSVVIPEGVKRIGDGAFVNCSTLTSIVIPEGVTAIGKDAFTGCRSIKSVKIPKSVTRIGTHAFSNCRSLTSVVIPEGVTEIGDGTFEGCNSLTSVVIPGSVTRIERDAFIYCPNLTIHAPAGSYAEGFAKWKGIPFETE